MRAVRSMTATRGRTGQRRAKDSWDDLLSAGPDTALGKVVRQYWQPIAVSRDVGVGKPVTVGLLGERFTLYRGESGNPHLVGERCAHRGTTLRVGSVEGEEIRCLYHGWKYDGCGACTEAPAEKPSVARSVRIAGYPAADYGGLVFVYLGAGEPPELPRRWEIDNATVLYAKLDVWPCNWFQLTENAFDPLHVNFVHRVGPLGSAVTADLPRIEFARHEWGFTTKAVRPNGNERIIEKHFPFGGHVVVPQPNDYAQPWIDLQLWLVPIDDVRTAYFKIYASRVKGAVAAELTRWFETSDYDVPSHHDALFDNGFPAFENSMHLTEAQDYLAQVGQGPVADRSTERLGASDVALVQYRRAMRREVEAFATQGRHRRWANRYGPANLPPPPGVKPA